MYYVVETNKSFEQACEDLDAAVKAIPFGVLHVHDLAATLRAKGFDFNNDCRVFEVCGPGVASQLLAADMHLNMALPCRISVFKEDGQVKIGMIKPEGLLAMLTDDPMVAEVAAKVQTQLQNAIDQAK